MEQTLPDTPCIAFANAQRRIALGDLPSVTQAVRQALEADPQAQILVFDHASGHVIDLDLRSSPALRRSAPSGDTPDSGAPDGGTPAATPERGRGRPKLGVVAREVTLLPRHWDWLGTQPGGASVALRKLVDQARGASEAKTRLRQAQEAAYRFMSAIAGDQPGFEEASRALFAGARERFAAETAAWPEDVRTHLMALATDALG